MSNTKSRTRLFLNNKRTSNTSTKDSFNSLENKNQIVLNKGPWTEKEDQLLKKWVKENGPYNWTKCSEFIKGRSGKQCREHWNNSLDPNLTKGQWTTEEDLLIMIFYEKYGGSWKRIIPVFPSRTENSIKNRFFSQLRKLASKNQQTGRKEYSTKFGLDTLKKFLPQATEMAKEQYFAEKKTNEKELEQYINEIDKLVKNRKKGIKFIDFDLLKNKKKGNNIIDVNENNEENIYDKEENMSTAKKNKKRKGKKKLEQSIKKEKIIEIDSEKDETLAKEGLLTYDETIPSIDAKKRKISNNSDNNNNININKTFKTKKSKDKKNIFINENVNKEINNVNKEIDNENVNKEINNVNKEIDNENKDNFLAPINNNKINYNKIIENRTKKENNEDRFHEFKIDKNIKEDDLDSKGSIEEIDKHLIDNKQIESTDKQTANFYKFFRNRIYRRIDSKKIQNNIEKGRLINPCISFENNEFVAPNYIINKNKNEEKFEKKNSINNSNGIFGEFKNKFSFGYHSPWTRRLSSRTYD